MRTAVGIFDVSHLGKAMVTGPGAAAHVNATLSNDLGKIAPGTGAVHAVLRRRDRRRRRRPDRLLPRRRARPAGPERRQHRRGRAPAAARPRPRACRWSTTTPTTPSSRVQGPRSDEVLTAVGLPVGHDYMSFVEAEWDGSGVVVCRTGYTGERGYELVVRSRRGRRALGRAAGGGRAARDAPVRPRCPRHAAHRDGLPAPRPGPHPRRHAGAGAARLGGRAGRRSGSGAATCCSPRRRPVPSGCCAGSRAVGRGIPRPGMRVSLTPDVPLCEVTSGTFSPTLAHRHRAGAGADHGRRRRRGGRRHPRPARDLPAGQATVRRHQRAGVLMLPDQPRHVPLARTHRAPLVVAPRGRRRHRGGRARASWRASGSPARPTPSRGWGRPGPSSPTTVSTR